MHKAARLDVSLFYGRKMPLVREMSAYLPGNVLSVCVCTRGAFHKPEEHRRHTQGLSYP